MRPRMPCFAAWDWSACVCGSEVDVGENSYGVGEEAWGVAEAGDGGEEGYGFVVVGGFVVLQVGGCDAGEVEGAEEVDFEDDVCWWLGGWM